MERIIIRVFVQPVDGI